MPEEPPAFRTRSASFNFHYLLMRGHLAEAEASIAYTGDADAAMKRWAAGRVYLNVIGDEGLSRIDEAFGPERFLHLSQHRAAA